MTSSQIDYLYTIPTVLLIIVPLWDLITNTSQRGLKRISKIGWLLFFLALVFAGLSTYKIHTQSIEKEQDKKLLDSTRIADKNDLKKSVDTALKKYGLQLDKGKNIITIIDTSNKKAPNPIMDILFDSVKFIGTFNRLFVSVEFKTINSGIAYNPRGELIIFQVLDGKLIERGPHKVADNSLIKAYDNQDYKFTTQVAYSNKPQINDTTYMFFKALYSNKQINGEDQYPLRGLFYVALDTIPKTVREIKIHPVYGSDQRHYLQKLLTQNKYW